MDLSVVIPLYNEEESLHELITCIVRVLEAEKLEFEIILIDDGSTDDSWGVINKLKEEQVFLKALRFQRNYGKSAALNVGFEQAKGEVILTMDADLQDNPDELPVLYRMIVDDGFDLVSGWKKKRYDPISKTIPTKLYNATLRRMSGLKLHDFNCGLKAYKKEVVKNIEVYGEMHRYIPVIAKWEGFGKITEKIVTHRPRKFGKTKFGYERFINGFLDLLTISFVSRFGKRPMHFFGTMGILFIFVGFVILLYLTIEKTFYSTTGMTDRPLFYFGILTLIIGTQLFGTGFLAELVSRSAPERNHYKIRETLGFH